MNLHTFKQGKSEKVTVSTSAVGFTALKVKPIPESMMGASAAFVTVEAAIRFTLDGTVPVAATKIGHVWSPGAALVIEGEQNLLNFKCVREGGTDTSIFVSYY